MARHTPHTLLPGLHHALHAALMPLHADMLRVCSSGAAETRLLQGHGARHLAHTALQPVGRLRLRPGSLEQDLAYNPDEDMTVEGNILELEFVLITILMDECSLKFAFSPRMETLDFDLLCKIHVVK